MKISGKIFDFYYYHSYYINDKDIALLMIALLHKKKIITDAKLKGMIRVLRENRFFRKLGSYHCDINGKWYDCDMEEVMNDLISYYDLSREEIDVVEFIQYVRLLENKNHNWCINYIYEHYFASILRTTNDYNHPTINLILNSFQPYLQLTEYSRPKRHYWDDCCCCCSCYDNDSEKHFHYKSESKRVSKEVVRLLNDKKKGRWQLAPYQIKEI